MKKNRHRNKRKKEKKATQAYTKPHLPDKAYEKSLPEDGDTDFIVTLKEIRNMVLFGEER